MIPVVSPGLRRWLLAIAWVFVLTTAFQGFAYYLGLPQLIGDPLWLTLSLILGILTGGAGAIYGIGVDE